MSNGNGSFVWYELMTSDLAVARKFYQTVIGWTVAEAGIPDMEYYMLSAGSTAVAGMMANPPGTTPMWVGYVGTADVDQTAAAITEAGGTVHKGPWEIPNVGRIAIVADPQCGMFALFKPPSGSEQPPAGGTAGHCGWRELHASDGQAAFAFYAPLFGWEKIQAVEMGPIGIYQIFGQGETQMGGMFSDPAAAGTARWLYYFNVDSIDTAAPRVVAAGGTHLSAPQQVPGGSWVVHCKDPQGAEFAIVGPR